MTQPLAHPGSLRDAVREVISNNVTVGYHPMRFVQATLGGEAPDLLNRCEGLVTSLDAVEAVEKAVETHPGLLTLEDYVVRWGAEWGFAPETIEYAGASSKMFDKLVGHQRFVAEGETPRG